MDNEKAILEAISDLRNAVSQGFNDMDGRFESLESRLGGQEKKLRRTEARQRKQAGEIAELQKIVRDLAQHAPLRDWGDTAAIRKEDAYRGFEQLGVGKVVAMRELEKAGTIRTTNDSKRTKTIWLDGKCQRVIIVEMGGEDA